MEKQKRIISDPYLTAFIFLNLNIKPSPVVDDLGKVSFEFSDNKALEDVIRRFYSDERGGRVCLDNLKQFLSDKLPRFMPLPASEVV